MIHHLLPVKHYHIIFTIPQELRPWFFYNQRACYNLLFRVAWMTIQSMAGQGVTGMVATLHTWGSNLSYHPHVHCIVPAGVFQNGKWNYSKGQSTGRFFCDAKQLRERYKALFIQHFVELIEFATPEEPITWKAAEVEKNETLFDQLQQDLKEASRKKWTVRIEKPVLGVEQIIEYLARYVKRVAITNSRIVAVDKTHVTIDYKQYHLQKKGHAAPIGQAKFEGAKFIQQFAQHIPPKGFHKVRYYGCYAYFNKSQKAEIYQSITKQAVPPYQVPDKKVLLGRMLGQDPDVCTNCGSIGTLVTSPLLEQSHQGYHLTKGQRNVRIRAGPKAGEPVNY